MTLALWLENTVLRFSRILQEQCTRARTTFEIYTRSDNVLIICSRHMRASRGFFWSLLVTKDDHIDLLTLECSNFFYPREVLHTLYRPHCPSVSFSHFQREIVHISYERSICGWWWGYILKAWLSPPYTVGQLQHKKEILVVLTLFGSSEDSPGSHKLFWDTHYSRLTMGYQG